MITQTTLASAYAQAQASPPPAIRQQDLLLPVQNLGQRTNSHTERGHPKPTGQHGLSILRARHATRLSPRRGPTSRDLGFLLSTAGQRTLVTLQSGHADTLLLSTVTHEASLTCCLTVIHQIPDLDPWQPPFGSREVCRTFRDKIYLSHPNLS